MDNTSAASHSSLHPVGGDPPSGCGFALPAGAGLAFGPQRVLSGVSLWGTPQIGLFASRQSALLACFLSWRLAVLLEAIGALSRVWDFGLAFLLPPFPLL